MIFSNKDIYTFGWIVGCPFSRRSNEVDFSKVVRYPVQQGQNFLINTSITSTLLLISSTLWAFRTESARDVLMWFTIIATNRFITMTLP